MKKQQLLYSFLPGFTVVVLTTQPTWADNVKPGGFEIKGYSETSSFNYFGITESTKVSNKGELLEPEKSKTSGSISNNLIKSNLSAINTFRKPEAVGFSETNVKGIGNNNESLALDLSDRSGKYFGLTTVEDISQRDVKGSETSSSIARNRVKSQAVISNKSSLLNPVILNNSGKSRKQRQLSNAVNLVDSTKLLPKTAKSKKVSTQHSRSGNPVIIKSEETVLRQTSVQKTRRNGLANRLRNLNKPSQKDSAKYRISQDNSPELVAPEVNPGRKNVVTPNNLDPSPNDLQYPTKPQEVRVKARQPITLAQALEIARKNNREFQVSLLQLERSRAALREAKAAWYPRVDLSTQLSRGQSASGQLSVEQGQETGQTPQGVTDPTQTQITGDAQLTYDIYTSGARQARVRRASEQVRLNELDTERLAEEIRLNVSTEYYNLQQADEQARIAQSAVNNAQASLQDAKALERAGVGTRFDVLRSEVNLANAVQDLTNAQSNQEVSRRQLANRLSLAQSADISAADRVKLAGLWKKSLEESIILAYQNRPELQQQLAQRNISEQNRKEALSSLGPQVSLIARYELLDQFDDTIGVTDGYTVALRANLNVFDGGAAKARAAQAKTDIRIAETQFAQQRNQIRFQVENSYSNLLSNRKNVRTAEAALGQAEEALRLARLRFQAGVGTQTDVIAAESELTRAQGNRVTAILDYNRALANLQRAITSRGIR